MKTTTFGLAIAMLSGACAQSPPANVESVAPAASSEAGRQSAAPTDAKDPTSTTSPDPTSSNPRTSLPAMSADRCVAEVTGTATDPKTGAPVSRAVDPQTGKPLCPPEP
jgi:hypothetical protein